MCVCVCAYVCVCVCVCVCTGECTGKRMPLYDYVCGNLLVGELVIGDSDEPDKKCRCVRQSSGIVLSVSTPVLSIPIMEGTQSCP